MAWCTIIVGGKILLTCHHGPDLNKQKKQRAKLKKNQREDHQVLKSRNLVQDSKKLDCPAGVLIRKIWKFPDFEILKKKTEWIRKTTSSKLRKLLAENEVKSGRRFYVQLPDPTQHKYHLQGEAAGITEQVDKRIIGMINDLVGDGVRSIVELRRHLDNFVKNELFRSETPLPPSRLRRRFYPQKKDLRNFMSKALVMQRSSKIDQENLLNLVERWREKDPSTKFFYRPYIHTKTRFRKVGRSRK